MNKHILAITILVIGAALFLGAQHLPHASGAAYDDSMSTAKQEAYWKERVKAVGGKAAYIELAEDVKSFSIQRQHKVGHAFGGALYEEEGVDGLAVCDPQFNYACYHEFLGRAIAELGLSSVSMLNQKCVDLVKKSPLSCQHGIGHGIVSYLGYSDKAFLEALKICKDLPFNDPIGGCYGGVFMEYNTQTMLGEQARLRLVVDDNMLAPCDTLATEYTIACVFWQPQWWNQTLKSSTSVALVSNTNEGRWAKMGELCESYKDSKLVRPCFEGIGNITSAEVNRNTATIKMLCEQTSSNSLHQLYCKSYAANSIGAGHREEGVKVCEGLIGSDADYCIKYAHNEANLANQIEPI